MLRASGEKLWSKNVVEAARAGGRGVNPRAVVVGGASHALWSGLVGSIPGLWPFTCLWRVCMSMCIDMDMCVWCECWTIVLYGIVCYAMLYDSVQFCGWGAGR